MPTITPDLEPFYGPDSPFAVDLVRQAPGAPVEFRGIVSEADQEAYDGLIVGTVVEVRWPTGMTLTEGDTVAEVEKDAAGAIVRTVRTFRVTRSGRRVIDGFESLAYMTEQPEA
jgi:hypothetical protein